MRAIRIHVDRHVRVISETAEGVHLEGSTRLQPGQLIDLVPSSAAAVIRRACVMTWSVARLGTGGPTYSGECLWEHGTGQSLP